MVACIYQRLLRLRFRRKLIRRMSRFPPTYSPLFLHRRLSMTPLSPFRRMVLRFRRLRPTLTRIRPPTSRFLRPWQTFLTRLPIHLSVGRSLLRECMIKQTGSGFSLLRANFITVCASTSMFQLGFVLITLP